MRGGALAVYAAKPFLELKPGYIEKNISIAGTNYGLRNVGGCGERVQGAFGPTGPGASFLENRRDGQAGGYG